MNEDNEIIRLAAAELICETVLTELQDSLDIASSSLEIDCDMNSDHARRVIFGMFRRFMSRHMDKLESDYFLDCGAIFLGYIPIDENTAPYKPKSDSDDSDTGNIAA